MDRIKGLYMQSTGEDLFAEVLFCTAGLLGWYLFRSIIAGQR